MKLLIVNYIERAYSATVTETIEMELTTREKLIFDLLKSGVNIDVDEILDHLENEGVGLVAKRATHSLIGVMKNLSMKAAQKGWIISMVDGGRGAGNKAVYRMKKRF